MRLVPPDQPAARPQGESGMPDIRIRLFGSPRIEIDGKAVDLGRRKALALACYLAAAGRDHAREVVAALLWPENDPASSRAELRRALSLLTTTFGSDLFNATRTSVSFSGQAWVDVARFRALLSECRGHGHAPQKACGRCLPLLEEAAAVSAADFLSGLSLGDCEEFESWRRDESERLRAERADALRRLCGLQEERGDLRGSIASARHWLALDPLCEGAHRQLMRLYVAAGQRSSALRQYQACERILRDEAGSEPETETTALFQLIRHRRTVRPGGAATGRSARSRRSHAALIAAGAVLLLFLAAGGALLAGMRAPRSTAAIAVLPLVDTSGRAGQEWFAEGMTEAVLTELARISSFRVTSHESVRRYAGADKPISRIRRELGVDFVLEGSVMRVDDRVRVSVQLINARRDSHVWAETYERTVTDALGMQREIAADVCERVRVRLSSSERTRLVSSVSVNAAAYEASLLGDYLLKGSMTPEGFQGAFESFKTAIARDPGFAPAYVGLANCYWGATQFGIFAPQEGMTRAKETAEKALSLDASLPGAHTVLALVHFLYDWDWAAAEREFKTAIALEPSSVDAHRWYGSLLSSRARHTEAIAQVKLARGIDPLSVLNGVNVAARLYYARQYDAAIAEALADEKMDPAFSMAPMVAGWAYAAQKDYPRAVAALTRSANLAGDWGMEPLAFLGYVYGIQGKVADARNAIARLDAMAEHGAIISPFLRAEPLLGLGDADQAIGLLVQAYDERDLNLVWNFQDPILDRLRDDPRFITLKQKLGL
jgi:TolB-like protein/DNA-binding SARP family transcriptional activator